MSEPPYKWHFVAEDETKAAHYLIRMCGFRRTMEAGKNLERCTMAEIMAAGVEAAHDAVTRAAKKLPKRGRGRPAINDDAHCLLVADAIKRDAIKRNDRISDQRAIERAAALHFKGDATAAVRRLRHKLGGKTLAAFATGQPVRYEREGTSENEFPDLKPGPLFVAYLKK